MPESGNRGPNAELCRNVDATVIRRLRELQNQAGEFARRGLDLYVYRSCEESGLSIGVDGIAESLAAYGLLARELETLLESLGKHTTRAGRHVDGRILEWVFRQTTPQFVNGADDREAGEEAGNVFDLTAIAIGNLIANAPSAECDEGDREETDTADTKADTPKKSSLSFPQSDELRRLIHELKRRLVPGVRQSDIAREFCEGNEKRAKNLLRQARLYKHLWKPPKDQQQRDT